MRSADACARTWLASVAIRDNTTSANRLARTEEHLQHEAWDRGPAEELELLVVPQGRLLAELALLGGGDQVLVDAFEVDGAGADVEEDAAVTGRRDPGERGRVQLAPDLLTLVREHGAALAGDERARFAPDADGDDADALLAGLLGGLGGVALLVLAIGDEDHIATTPLGGVEDIAPPLAERIADQRAAARDAGGGAFIHRQAEETSREEQPP